MAGSMSSECSASRQCGYIALSSELSGWLSVGSGIWRQRGPLQRLFGHQGTRMSLRPVFALRGARIGNLGHER